MGRARIKDFDGRICVVTGAASGIGRAAAIELAGKGARLALCDRNPDALAETARECAARAASGSTAGAATKPFVQAFDITSTEETEAFAAAVFAELGVPEAVFHVAGISIWGAIDVMPQSDWERLIDINLMGTVRVVRAFVPAMISAGRPGALAMVSSAAGLIGMPWHSAYSATKFGVRGIAEVLRFDLESKQISIHVVTPGAVDTPLVKSLEISGVDTSDPAVAKAQQQFSRHAVSPEQAAAKMIAGVTKGKYIVQTSPDIALAFAAQRYFPPAYSLAMRLLNRKLMRVARDAGIDA